MADDIERLLRRVGTITNDDATVEALLEAGFQAEATGECACFYGGFCGGDGVIRVRKGNGPWRVFYMNSGWVEDTA